MDPLDALTVIERVMLALYSERRLDGDAMRDKAQSLHVALETLRPIIHELFEEETNV